MGFVQTKSPNLSEIATASVDSAVRRPVRVQDIGNTSWLQKGRKGDAVGHFTAGVTHVLTAPRAAKRPTLKAQAPFDV